MIPDSVRFKAAKDAVGYCEAEGRQGCDHCGHAFRGVFFKRDALSCDKIGIQNCPESFVDGGHRCRKLKLAGAR